MYIATAAAMRQIDQRTIQSYYVPGIVLMEQAGLQVLRVMQDCFPALLQQQVVIVTGSGNNGGDGFVVARHLWHGGGRVCVILLAASTRLRGDARRAYAMARAYGVPMFTCTTEARWRQAQTRLQTADVIVDALLGTGLRTAPTGLYATAIATINALQKPIVAVDIPSGVAADDGRIPGTCIQAAHTVTFALPKRAMVLHPAAATMGQLHVVNIGIPPQAIEAEALQVSLVDAALVRQALPQRRPDAHKGSHGHLCVVAGSVGKSGAGVLASQAALRAGAGLVTWALPMSLAAAMAARLTEVMTLPVAETPQGALAAEAIAEVAAFLPQANALVVGPGLGTHPTTVACVHAILAQARVPVVLDADGLNALVGHLEVLHACHSPVILTPHPGEMARLVGTDTATIQRQRLEVACELAQRYRVYVVLKGAYTVVYAPDGRRWVNPTGNPAMATAGTGDVLAGAIGALLCQGLSPLQAAQCGAYLHGLAGDQVRARLGPQGLLASDLIAAFPAAIQAVY